MIDLLVAGGGPAGLATALHARRNGLEVLVIEPRNAPIDKACGEGLTPAAVSALRALDVDPPGQPLRGITYRDSRHQVSARYVDQPGRGVRRTDLHRALHAAASDAGVRFTAGHARDVDVSPSGVRVDDHRAGYLAGADGLHSTVRHLVDPGRRQPSIRRWGMRAHYRTAPWTDHVEVSWTADSEIYVTPVADNLVGVAVLSAVRRRWPVHLSGVPELAARLPTQPVTKPIAAGPLLQRVDRRVRHRALLVGDAAGYVDALTGEGLALAFAEAAAAANHIAAGTIERYERDYHRITREYRWLTGFLLTAATHTRLRPHIVPLAARHPSLFARAVRRIAAGATARTAA